MTSRPFLVTGVQIVTPKTTVLVKESGAFQIKCKATDWFRKCTIRSEKGSCYINWTSGKNVEIASDCWITLSRYGRGVLRGLQRGWEEK